MLGRLDRPPNEPKLTGHSRRAQCSRRLRAARIRGFGLRKMNGKSTDWSRVLVQVCAVFSVMDEFVGLALVLQKRNRGRSVSRILITGGSGFIGTNLVEHFSTAGHEVLNLDIQKPRNPAAKGEFKYLDILDRPTLIHEVNSFDPEHIVHLAARTDLEGKSVSEYAPNTEGVSNVVAAARAARSLKRALFASSMFVCNMGYVPQREDDYCPHTVYGKSKVIGEQIVRREAGDAFSWALFRPTSIWGPWFKIPYITFFHIVRKGLYFHPQGYSIRRSYGFVLNVIHQLGQLLAYEDSAAIHGRVFYVADCPPTDPFHWAQAIASCFGSHKIHQVPVNAMWAGAKAGDLLRRLGLVAYPPLFTSRLNNLLTSAVFDLTPIKEISGEQPYSLEEGVALTVEWMQRYDLPDKRKQPERYAKVSETHS